MKVKFDCPHCGHRLFADASQTARRSACPRCRREVSIPVVEPSATPRDSSLALPDASTAVSASSTLFTTCIDTCNLRLDVHESTTLPREKPVVDAPARRSAVPAVNGQSARGKVAPAPQPSTTTAVAATAATPRSSASSAPDSSPRPSTPSTRNDSADWYVRPTGSDDTFGPATDQELDAWIDQGRVVEETFLRQGATGPWRQARELLERFASPAPRTASEQPSDAVPQTASPAPFSQARKLGLRRRPSRSQRLAVLVVLLLAVAVLGPTMIYLALR